MVIILLTLQIIKLQHSEEKGQCREDSEGNP